MLRKSFLDLFTPFKYPLVAVIRLTGVIAHGIAFGKRLSDESLAPIIERSFKLKPTAIALIINSPGVRHIQADHHDIYNNMNNISDIYMCVYT